MFIFFMIWALALEVIANQTDVDMAEALQFFQKMHDLQNNVTTQQRSGADEQNHKPSIVIHDPFPLEADADNLEDRRNTPLLLQSREDGAGNVERDSRVAKSDKDGKNRRFITWFRKLFDSHPTVTDKTTKTRRMFWFNNILNLHETTNPDTSVVTTEASAVSKDEKRLYEWFKKRYGDSFTSTSKSTVGSTNTTEKPVNSKPILRLNSEIDEVLVKLNDVLDRLNKNQLDRSVTESKPYFLLFLNVCKDDHEKVKVSRHNTVPSNHFRVRRDVDDDKNTDLNENNDKVEGDIRKDDNKTNIVFVRTDENKDKINHTHEDKAQATDNSNYKGENKSKLFNAKSQEIDDDFEKVPAIHENHSRNYDNIKVKSNEKHNSKTNTPPRIPVVFPNTLKYVTRNEKQAARPVDENLTNEDDDNFKLLLDPNHDIPLVSGRRNNNESKENTVDIKNGRKVSEFGVFTNDINNDNRRLNYGRNDKYEMNHKIFNDGFANYNNDINSERIFIDEFANDYNDPKNTDRGFHNKFNNDYESIPIKKNRELNNNKFENENSVKNKILSYIDNGFNELKEKIAPLDNIKDFYKNDNAFKTGYIAANLDTLDNNLGKMKDDLDGNKYAWNEKHVLDLFEMVTTANNVVGKLMDTVRSFTDAGFSNNPSSEDYNNY